MSRIMAAIGRFFQVVRHETDPAVSPPDNAMTPGSLVFRLDLSKYDPTNPNANDAAWTVHYVQPLSAYGVGNMVRRERVDRDASLRDVEEASNVHRMRIGEIERGRVEPRLDELAALLRALPGLGERMQGRDAETAMVRLLAGALRIQAHLAAHPREASPSEASPWWNPPDDAKD